MNLDGFIIKKFVSMHGHMKVKFHSLVFESYLWTVGTVPWVRNRNVARCLSTQAESSHKSFIQYSV